MASEPEDDLEQAARELLADTPPGELVRPRSSYPASPFPIKKKGRENQGIELSPEEKDEINATANELLGAPANVPDWFVRELLYAASFLSFVIRHPEKLSSRSGPQVLGHMVKQLADIADQAIKAAARIKEGGAKT